MEDLEKNLKTFVKGLFFFLILVLAILIVFIGVVLVGGSLFLDLDEDNSLLDSEVYEYQYLVLNPSTDKVSVGFLTLLEKYEKDQYSFTREDNGNLKLISNINSNQYHVIGSCSCLGEKTTTSSKIQYLIASSEEESAYKVSKKQLEKECEKKLSNCPITSKEYKIEKMSSKVPEMDFDKEVETYICNGYCLPDTLNVGEEMKKRINEYGCKDLQKTKEIAVFVVGLEKKEIIEFAQEKFRFYELEDFCKEASVFEEFADIKKKNVYDYDYDAEKESKIRRSACFDGGEESNSRIKCIISETDYEKYNHGFEIDEELKKLLEEKINKP